MDTIFVSAGLSLIALTGGMFLMAKVNKDSLGILFKIVAYFVIIGSFINLGCTALHCVGKLYAKQHYHRMMMMEKNCGDSHSDYHHGKKKYHHSGTKACCKMGHCKDESRYDTEACSDKVCCKGGPGHIWRKEKTVKMMNDSLFGKRVMEK